MDAQLEKARQLKQLLIEFVLEAEGELAQSLESYMATKLRSLGNRYDDTTYKRNLLVDSFLSEGNIRGKTPLDLFVENHQELSENDRTLIKKWQQSFIGLFAIKKKFPDSFKLMNWLTAKEYIVKPNDPTTLKEMARFKEGEILLTRIAPVTDTFWMFSGPCISMGCLGKPKLAVAVGNFKKDYGDSLYSDAPELLEQAWQSVEKYHQEFVEFFGSDEITLPGYELNKKIAELQEKINKRLLTAAGIDDSQSFAEIAQEAGVTEEEVKVAAQEAGADEKVVSQLFDTTKGEAKMAMPKVELPDDLKKSPNVTALTHPKWGQMFLSTYSKFKTLLEAEDWQNLEGYAKQVRQYLEDPKYNTFVLKKLAKQYPCQLEKVLQAVLEQPNFQIERDLDPLLQKYNKPLEPDLPEIASVPLHLHNLFEEALLEVSKTKSKSKGKNKKNRGRGFK